MTTANTKANHEAQIRRLLDDWVSKLRSKDSNGFLSHYAADLVQFALAPPLKHAGANALNKKALDEWFSSFHGSIRYEIRDLSIAAGDSVAFCHSLNHLSGRKTAGEQVDMWLRVTVCFRRIEGKWMITHSHESVPFYMDGSYKAAVDLKP
jgi:ketosteroid isomerase-like protein